MRLYDKVPSVLSAMHIDRHFARDKDGAQLSDSTLTQMRSAVEKARKVCEQVMALRDSLAEDVSLTPGAAGVKIKEAALKHGERAAKELDSARQKANEEIARLAAATLPPQPSGPIGTEIRARLAAMPEKERHAVIEKAVAVGDVTTAGAVLGGAPRFLSGVSDPVADRATARWRESNHAEDYDRLGRLTEAVAALSLAGDGLVTFTKKISTNPVSQNASAAKARTSEAEAALEAVA